MIAIIISIYMNITCVNNKKMIRNVIFLFFSTKFDKYILYNKSGDINEHI